MFKAIGGAFRNFCVNNQPQQWEDSHQGWSQGYTLVELIVVIAILVVLSTVGFVGYSQYTASSRDGARVSDLRAIYQGIGVSISQKGIAPAPDSPISIYASTGVLLSLQGSVGESVRQAIGLESGGRDPQDGVGYTYLRNKDKKSVQLMALFEAEEMGAKIALGESGVWGESIYAATDYTDRYPAAFGKKLGVLVQRTTNTPLQEVSSYTASGVNLGLTSIASGSGILVIGNTGSGISENLSGTGVLARVLSPASLVVAGSIPSGPKGTSATDSAISCKALKTNGVSTDGLYWIKPTADPAFQAYCDMVTDGGGWTLVVRIESSNNLHNNAAAVGTLTSPTQTASAKLSDIIINGFGDKLMYRAKSGPTQYHYFDTNGPYTSVAVSQSRASKTLTGTMGGPYPFWGNIWLNTYNQTPEGHYGQPGSPGFVFSVLSAYVYWGNTGAASETGQVQSGTVWVR